VHRSAKTVPSGKGPGDEMKLSSVCYGSFFHTYRIHFFPALIFAHRLRCAAAILFLPAAEMLRPGLLVVDLCPPSLNIFMAFSIASMFC
jgi:hypothetical protein